eukprot:1066017-Pelagomonas_calceolata.AAC.7
MASTSERFKSEPMKSNQTSSIMAIRMRHCLSSSQDMNTPTILMYRYSIDSLLHAGPKRGDVFAEVARILKPGWCPGPCRCVDHGSASHMHPPSTAALVL